MARTGPVILRNKEGKGRHMGHLQRTAQSGSGCSLEDCCEVFGCENGKKSWVHLTRKYQQIEFPMTRHHNQCFVKLSQLTDNKQDPTHDHNIQSTCNANTTPSV